MKRINKRKWALITVLAEYLTFDGKVGHLSHGSGVRRKTFDESRRSCNGNGEADFLFDKPDASATLSSSDPLGTLKSFNHGAFRVGGTKCPGIKRPMLAIALLNGQITKLIL